MPKFRRRAGHRYRPAAPSLANPTTPSSSRIQTKLSLIAYHSYPIGDFPLRTIRTALAFLAAFAVLAAVPCLAQANYSVLNTFHIGGEGAWDYVTIDSAGHRLFVTRTTHTQAIDTTTGKLLGDIPGQVRSHGVAIVPRLNRGFITDGGGKGAIIVFDLKTYAVLGSIP